MSGLAQGWAATNLAELTLGGGLFVDGDWVESKDQDPEGDVRLIQLADIGEGRFLDKSSRFLTSKKAAELRCTYLEAGDVLIARMPDPLGRACLYPGESSPAVTVVDVCIVKPLASIDPNWLMHTINAPQFRIQINAFQSGSTRRRISRSNLSRLQLPLPPLAEQRRMVAEIEKQFTRLDEADGLLLTAERKLKRYDSVIIRKAFSSDFPMRSLREIASIKGGLTMHSDRRDLDRCAPVPYLRVANVQRGFLDLTTVKTIMATPEEVQELALQSGDVLFTEGGDRDKLGRGWIWQDEISTCIHQNHVFRARLNGSVRPKWLSYYANELGQQYFLKEGKQTTNLASINITKLGFLPVPAPLLGTQEQILADLEAAMSVSKRLAEELDRARIHTARLRQSILAKAFSGQLVPQDPSDEPATVLLDRIRAERGRGETAVSKPRRVKPRSASVLPG